MTSELAQAFILKVQTEGVGAGPNFWTAYAQGYLAALQGREIPERIKSGFHAVDHDFKRGYSDALATL